MMDSTVDMFKTEAFDNVVGKAGNLLNLCMKYRLIIGISILLFLVSCTGPHLWVNCYNRTEYFEAISLERIATSEYYVDVIESNSDNTIDVQLDGEFAWIIRLYNGKDEVFSDSGNVNIDKNYNDRCIVEPDTAGTFVIRWGE